MAKKPKIEHAWLGPTTGFTLSGGREIILVKGRTYPDLPAGDPHINGLVARGLLVAPEAVTADAAPIDPPSGDNDDNQ